MTSTRYQRVLIFILFFLVAGFVSTYAGTIRGVVRSESGEPLAYATIFVKQTGSGAVTDLMGKYEIQLAPGTYDITFQYLGYEAITRIVIVDANVKQVDVVLKSQAMVLQNVTILAGDEDPAYTIMRKTIAKAKYHTQEIDSYSAKVYMKGRGKLLDYPWLAKKALEKEGIKKDRLFISESVSEVLYTRPNKFEEKVIAVYSDGDDNNTSPNAYVFGSFYEPEIAETISPLSPRAFSYYRFEYQGSFRDRDYEVSKIKVTPRSKGDNVFEGILFIVEDWWSIHSLDLKVTKLGINFEVEQLYNPMEDDNAEEDSNREAWLPVSQKFKVEGKVFGFEFVYDYLATVKDYKIKLNKDLPFEMNVVDEKIEKEKAKEIESNFGSKDQNLQERLESGKEITNKELRSLIRDYEKEERKSYEEPEVLSDTKYTVDSSAYDMDSVFWREIRPTPLTIEEIKGYQIADSLAEIERKKEEGDSLKPSKHKGFQWYDVFIGDSYKLNKTTSARIYTPWGGFNTVEGFNLIYRLGYSKRWVERDSLNPDDRPKVSRFDVSPIVRYAFARQKLTGVLRLNYRNSKSQVMVEAGRYIRQFNEDEPIHEVVNSFTTLFLTDNLMKIYERDFVGVDYRQKIDSKLTFSTNWNYAKRRELFNNSDFKLIDTGGEGYTPNEPENLEINTTSFFEHYALIGSAGLEWRPWQKYRVRNGRKYSVNNSSPALSVDYTKGFNALNSSVDFDRIELGLKYGIRVGIRGKLDIAMTGGKFLNTEKLYFMDFAHFLGNRTPFVTTDPVGSYRLLDYYAYSTKDKYFTANLHYHFRRFLITQFPIVRITGITENIFVNYLATPFSNDFTEVGYSIDGILRILRLEAAVSFSGGIYQQTGFRIGIATSITSFDD